MVIRIKKQNEDDDWPTTQATHQSSYQADDVCHSSISKTMPKTMPKAMTQTMMKATGPPPSPGFHMFPADSPATPPEIYSASDPATPTASSTSSPASRSPRRATLTTTTTARPALLNSEGLLMPQKSKSFHLAPKSTKLMTPQQIQNIAQTPRKSKSFHAPRPMSAKTTKTTKTAKTAKLLTPKTHLPSAEMPRKSNSFHAPQAPRVATLRPRAATLVKKPASVAPAPASCGGGVIMPDFHYNRSLRNSIGHEPPQRQRRQQCGSYDEAFARSITWTGDHSRSTSYLPYPLHNPASDQDHNSSYASCFTDHVKSHCKPPKTDLTPLHPTFSLPALASFLTALGFLLYSFQHYSSQVANLQQDIHFTLQGSNALQEAHSHLLQELHDTQHQIYQLQSARDNITRSNKVMAENIQKLKAQRKDMTELQEYQLLSVDRKEKVAIRKEKRLEKFMKDIQEFSKLQVIQRYGEGPHYVQLDMQLPSSSKTNSNIQTIQIQLAPLSLMPHSIHTFLSQISIGLWNNKTFDLHAGHVLMANPTPIITTKEDDVSDVESSLTVQFPEYHKKFPHAKYTVAFPGRPNSGPGFYINLDHNNRHHSPHVPEVVGLEEEEEDEVSLDSSSSSSSSFIEGEPCFGNIIQGREIVDIMDELPMYPNGALKQPVKIVQARII